MIFNTYGVYGFTLLMNSYNLSSVCLQLYVCICMLICTCVCKVVNEN